MKKIANILLFICCLFVGLKSYADVLYEDDMSNGWTLKKTKSAAGTCGLTQDKGLNWTFDVSLAWASKAEVSLYNKEGLPAGPFRTDSD